jgi:glutamyl-tRNA synthetase
VNRAPGRFDFDKCKWVNQQHLMLLSPADFTLAAQPFVAAAGLPVPANFAAVMAAVQDKVRLLGEVPPAVDFLLLDEFSYDGETVAKVRGNGAAKELLGDLAAGFNGISTWSADAAKEVLSATARAAGAKPGQLMFPLRVALSGRAHGPDLGDMLDLLGKDRCTARVRRFVAML